MAHQLEMPMKWSDLAQGSGDTELCCPYCGTPLGCGSCSYTVSALFLAAEVSGIFSESEFRHLATVGSGKGAGTDASCLQL